MEERDAGNPFLPRRDELVTQDMHTCDLCGRWCSGPVYRVCLCYADQSRVASEVCADCMWRLGFRPVRTVPLATYWRYERWVSEHPTAGGGAPMIYLIVDGELVDILTEMDEALAKAKALAEHAGKVEIADLVTGRRTIIKQARKGNRR